MTAATPATAGGAAQSASPDLFTSAIPEPYRILGRQLLPLSVGRYRLLRRFDCAFVADESRAAGVEDLLLGVLVCSMRVEDFLELAASPRFNREIRAWGKRVAPWAWLTLIPGVRGWYLRRLDGNLAVRMALFQDYVAKAQEVPRYTRLQNSPATHAAHWAHSLEVTLRHELNWSAEEIGEAPLQKALADYFSFAAQQGILSLVSDEDVTAAQHNDAVFAAAFKEEQ
jgi:hypothetical protein